MKVKIKVTTPVGQAEGTSKKLKPFLIGFNKVQTETYVSPENDCFFIDVEGEPRRVLKVMQNAYGYSAIVNKIFETKIMGKGIDDYLDKPEDKEQLEKMLKDGTKVEIIKDNDINMLFEPKKTFWEHIKEKFKRID